MKQKFFKLTGVIILIMLILNGCTKKEDPQPDPILTVVSVGKQISSFKLTTPAVTGAIDTVARTILLSVPAGTSLTGLSPEIVLAANHTITPASGVAQNFTSPVVYTVKRPDNTTTTWTVTIALANITVDQDITQSVTWTSDKTYVISGSIEVANNSVLTIQPGTVIKFQAGASLSIGYSGNATFIANGTADKPIIFTSSALAPAAGAWEGLFFYDKTLSNTSMAYCSILYAGSDSNYGALNIYGCDLAVNNCKITYSGSYGIKTTYSNSKGGFVSFENNAVTASAKYGLVISAQKVGAIGAGNTFATSWGVSIFGDYNNATAQTWRKLDVPYIISDEVDIDGSLTIEAGTTFKFDANGWLAIGYYSATTFAAEGLATAPITFTSSATSPAAGAWRGIAFYGFAQTNSKMKYCIIDYAGSTSTYGALDMNGTASVTFTNNIIRNSGSFGVNLDWDAGFQAFTNNTISSCANHLIVINTKHLPELGASNLLTASANKGILISGDYRYSNPVTWKKQTADFYVTGGELDIDGILTIEAGCHFLFETGSFFWFGYYQSTKVTAIGTSNDKIVFTSSSASPAAQGWKGLVFDDSYTQTNSELSYCQFQYTGYQSKPAIYAGVSFPVSNTTITDFGSAHAAEYKTGNTIPAGTGNNFTWIAN